MRRAMLLVVVLLAMAAPACATVLVSETGQPLTGYLATWATHMHAYSVASPVVVHLNNAGCSWNTPACAGDGQQIWWAPARLRRSQTTQVTLYHELGHEFDFAYMTDADHAHLARWLNHDVGAHLTAWFTGDTWDSESQDSLGEYFADAYANCAQHDTVNEDPRICAYVNQVGRTHHAARPFRCPTGQFRWLDPACYPVSRQRVREAVKRR